MAYPVLSSIMLLVCGLISLEGVARGQGPNHGASKFYPDSSEKAETLLRNAASLARDSQWSEAIDIYQNPSSATRADCEKFFRDDPGEAMPPEPGPSPAMLALADHCNKLLHRH
ncbi:MAG: hypothetical protein ACXWO1_00430 [Isosphaeraceae bacterium]